MTVLAFVVVSWTDKLTRKTVWPDFWWRKHPTPFADDWTSFFFPPSQTHLYIHTTTVWIYHCLLYGWSYKLGSLHTHLWSVQPHIEGLREQCLPFEIDSCLPIFFHGVMPKFVPWDWIPGSLPLFSLYMYVEKIEKPGDEATTNVRQTMRKL